MVSFDKVLWQAKAMQALFETEKDQKDISYLTLAGKGTNNQILRLKRETSDEDQFCLQQMKYFAQFLK